MTSSEAEAQPPDFHLAQFVQKDVVEVDVPVDDTL